MNRCNPRAPAREERVRARFEEPLAYLKPDAHVEVRAIATRQLLGELDRATILELGCGDGRISLQYLSETNRVTLVDFSSEMLELARRRTPADLRHNVNFIRGDLHDHDPDGGYDVVLCLGVLAHVDCPEATVAKISQLLNPGGRCILQLTDFDRPAGKLLYGFHAARGLLRTRSRYLLTRTSMRHIDRLAGKNGLRAVARRRHFPLFPGMGRLPSPWLLRFQLFTLQNRFLSSFGSETIALYSKEPRSGRGGDRTPGLAGD